MGEVLCWPHRIRLMANSGEHALRSGYKMWYMLRGGKIGQDKGEYEKGFKTIGTFNTVEQFWTCYSHITRAEALPNLDLHMFKDGIKPMWEDAANKIGGKAMVRVHKTLAARCWEAVLLAIIGEQFGVGDEITGAVLTIKARSHVKISVWNRTSSNTAAIEKIRSVVPATYSNSSSNMSSPMYTGQKSEY